MADNVPRQAASLCIHPHEAIRTVDLLLQESVARGEGKPSSKASIDSPASK